MDHGSEEEAVFLQRLQDSAGSDSEVEGSGSEHSVSSPMDAALHGRYSRGRPGGGPSLELSGRVQLVADTLYAMKAEFGELKQDASDLQEYSNAKINRVKRYLVTLTEKARGMDSAAREAETRIAPLKKERRKLFNELLNLKGKVRVFCRVRPSFEHEGDSACTFPDTSIIRVATSAEAASTGVGRKEFDFDEVYGPHVDQARLFEDVQPLVQSVMDGHNVCILAYGQTGSGKTHTLEGLPMDRGLYFQMFDEVYHLANESATVNSQYKFAVSILEIYNEQIRDVLSHSSSRPSTPAGSRRSSDVGLSEFIQEPVESPASFANIFKMAARNRANLPSKFNDRPNRSHFVVTISIDYLDTMTGESVESHVSLVDMAGSERLPKGEASGDRLTESLHINKSLSALGDVLSALTVKKSQVPYKNSLLTTLLADSLGGDSKVLLIANCSPGRDDAQETLCTLNFAARARNIEQSLANRDNVKKWRDMANESRREVFERDARIGDLQKEVLELRHGLERADAQAALLFHEVQNQWARFGQMQGDLDAREREVATFQAHARELAARIEQTEVQHRFESDMAEEAFKKEMDSQAAGFAREMEDQKLRIQWLERQVGEAREAAEVAAAAAAATTLRARSGRGLLDDNHQGSEAKLQEELKMRDDLIEQLHQENERLMEERGRLHSLDAQRNAAALSQPLTERSLPGRGSNAPAGTPARVGSGEPGASAGGGTAAGSLDRVPSGSGRGGPQEGGAVGTKPLTASSGQGPQSPQAWAGTAQVKPSPAGEYLSQALTDFDPDSFESPAALADGANKLLMLVLAGVIKAGSTRERELLMEIRMPVFKFLRRMEGEKVMDTMLVSRVRMLYVRSLIQEHVELQALHPPPLGSFLGKPLDANSSSPSLSPGAGVGDSSPTEAGSETGYGPIEQFKINLRTEKKSGLKGLVRKWGGGGGTGDGSRQHLTPGRLREIGEEARAYAIGNKPLAALFAHTTSPDLSRQLRSWLAEAFEFLYLVGEGGATSETEMLSTAIMDGWLAGLGVPAKSSTDILGQLLGEYTRIVYLQQLSHLRDVASTMTLEEVDDVGTANKLRTALDSVEHRRQKVLGQMRADPALLSPEEGGVPLPLPLLATEDGRVRSLVLLEQLIKEAAELVKETDAKPTRHRALAAKLETLVLQLPGLLPIDQVVADRYLTQAQEALNDAAVEMPPDPGLASSPSSREPDIAARSAAVGTGVGAEPAGTSGRPGAGGAAAATEVTVHLGGGGEAVIQWTAVQFSIGISEPIVIKCGGNSRLELVVQGAANRRGVNGGPNVPAGPSSGGMKLAVLPVPGALVGMTLDEITSALSHVPDSLVSLAMAKTADGTRARYTRLYKTLAARVPVLHDALGPELAEFTPVRGPSPPSAGRRGSGDARLGSTPPSTSTIDGKRRSTTPEDITAASQWGNLQRRNTRDELHVPSATMQRSHTLAGVGET